MCVPYFKYVVCIIKQFQNPIKRKKKQLRRKHVLPHAGLIIISTQLPLIKTVFGESGKITVIISYPISQFSISPKNTYMP